MSSNILSKADVAVQKYIAGLKDESQRLDSARLIDIMYEATGEMPYMMGSSIVGFGTYHYKYESGREGDTVTVGFSARKQALTLYGVIFYDQGIAKLSQLGKHTTGKGCLYIKRLADIDEAVLTGMIRRAYQEKTQS